MSQDQGTELKFYYNNLLSSSGSTLIATSTSTGAYAIDNIHNMLEVNGWKGTTVSSTQVIDLDLGNGYIDNGDFETGTTASWTKVDSGVADSTFAISTVSPYVGTYKSEIQITNSGTVISDIQFISTAIQAIEKGKTQYVGFASKCASATRNIQAQIIQRGSPFTDYTVEGQTTYALTTAWQYFTQEYTGSTNAEDASLRFFLGLSSLDVDFDNISWWSEPYIIPKADYIAISGHNLATAFDVPLGSTRVKLSFADDSTTYSDAYTPEAVQTKKTYLKEFTQTGIHRYWRISLSGLATSASINICSFGMKSSIAFIQPPFDPHSQKTIKNTNITEGGYVAGIHTKYTERNISLGFGGVSTSLYSILDTWHEVSGMKNFFMAWDTTNDSSAVYLVRPDGNFNNPINMDKFRNVTINLKGRKE